MMVDLPLTDAAVLVVGGGTVGARKVESIAKECGRVTVVSKSFSRRLGRLERAGVRLVRADAADGRSLNRLLSRADIVIAATNDRGLNARVAARTRARGVMVGSIDDPAASDFRFPAVGVVGSVRVGVSTGGKSPAMARLICRKLTKMITKEERLKVELLGQVRSLAKQRLPTPERRKAAMYRVLKDREVGRLLRNGKLKEARSVAERIIGSG